MKKAAFILIILTVISKILGFGRDLILSYYYGATFISDAYIISTTIPTIIFAFVGKGISTSYIPLYSEIEKNKDVRNADNFTSNFVNILLIICTVIFILGFVFIEPIVTLFASGFEGDTFRLTVQFTKVTLIGIYFTSLIYVFSAYLQIKGNFTSPALSILPANLVIIFSIVISSKGELIYLAWGVIISAVAQLFYILFYVAKENYRHGPIVNIRDKYLPKIVYLALPVVLGVAVNDINIIVDRTIASQISEGSISALNYAYKFNGFIQGVFVISFTTVMYPIISRMAADNKLEDLKKIILESIGGISLLIVPSIIGTMFFSNQIISLLFGRGAFNEDAIMMTSGALFYYAIGLLGVGVREVISRPFYSLQDTKTPMLNAMAGMVINIILNIVLSQFMGINGLALATSISALITASLMFISLRKKIGPFGMKKIFISFLKVLFASLVMGLIAKLSFNYLTANILNQNLSLIISIGIGALTYFIIIYFMKIDDVDVIVNTVKKKLMKNKATV